jgi:hypothetical protein
LVAAINADEVEQEGAIGGVQTVDNRYKQDSLYNPYPYQIYVHHNVFENSYWFPSLSGDIGKLFLTKSFMSPPDIAYDGIHDPEMKDAEICIHQNGDITVMSLDAANDFKGLSKDPRKLDCQRPTMILQ